MVFISGEDTAGKPSLVLRLLAAVVLPVSPIIAPLIDPAKVATLKGDRGAWEVVISVAG
jgi:hypothetical protein